MIQKYAVSRLMTLNHILGDFLLYQFFAYCDFCLCAIYYNGYNLSSDHIRSSREILIFLSKIQFQECIVLVTEFS